MANELETDYVVAEREIIIDIEIEQAQLGASLLRLDGKHLTKGDIRTFTIGKGPDLRGKALFVKTIVSDVNDKTNLTSVVYTLRGGKIDQSFRLSVTVQNEGDSVIYRAWFNLQ